MAALIPTSTTLADADFTLTDGQTARIALAPPAGGSLPSGCFATVRYKTGSDYTAYAVLESDMMERCLFVVSGAGVWNVQKLAGPNFGIDKV